MGDYHHQVTSNFIYGQLYIFMVIWVSFLEKCYFKGAACSRGTVPVR